MCVVYNKVPLFTFTPLEPTCLLRCYAILFVFDFLHTKLGTYIESEIYLYWLADTIKNYITRDFPKTIYLFETVWNFRVWASLKCTFPLYGFNKQHGKLRSAFHNDIFLNNLGSELSSKYVLIVSGLSDKVLICRYM